MDNKTAAILLTSLLERVDREQTIGVVSSLERQALQRALQALGNGSELVATSVPSSPVTIESPPAEAVPAHEAVAVAAPNLQQLRAEPAKSPSPPPLPKVVEFSDLTIQLRGKG